MKNADFARDFGISVFLKVAWIFAYIQNHKEVFETYFKIGICGKGENYQETFFRNGVHGIARLWFEGGCKETPKAMGKIVKREYLKLFG